MRTRTLRDQRRSTKTWQAGAALAVLALTGAAACSSDPEPTVTSPGVTGTSVAPPGTLSESPSKEELLAEAKSVAVGFFSAQAVNDFDKALDRSSGAAAHTVEWARGVNTLEAANDTPYQIPSVNSPNARVEIDDLVEDEGVWKAQGFVELSYRPGTVATSSTTAPSQTGTTVVSASGAPATYITDLEFDASGDSLRLVDYRLDDTPYPVSELYVALDGVEAEAAGMRGTLTHARRNLDGSVQYLGEAERTGDAEGEIVVDEGTFTPEGATAPTGTAMVYADPVDENGAGMLVVLPGAFPGGPGTLSVSSSTAPASTGTTVAGSIPSRSLDFTVPEWPKLVPQPVDRIKAEQAVASTTSSSESTTTSTTEEEDEESTTTTGQQTRNTNQGPTSSGTSPTSSSSTTSSSTTSTTA